MLRITTPTAHSTAYSLPALLCAEMKRNVFRHHKQLNVLYIWNCPVSRHKVHTSLSCSLLVHHHNKSLTLYLYPDDSSNIYHQLTLYIGRADMIIAGKRKYLFFFNLWTLKAHISRLLLLKCPNLNLCHILRMIISFVWYVIDYSGRQ
jgi:hypothetical protein